MSGVPVPQLVPPPPLDVDGSPYNVLPGDTGNVPAGNSATPYDVQPDRVGVALVERPGDHVPFDALDRPPGVVTRQAGQDVTTYTRPWRLWRMLGGDHGLVPEPNEAPDLVGGQRPWSTYDPRTFRSIPVAPWDAGSEVGARA